MHDVYPGGHSSPSSIAMPPPEGGTSGSASTTCKTIGNHGSLEIERTLSYGGSAYDTDRTDRVRDDTTSVGHSSHVTSLTLDHTSCVKFPYYAV